MTLSASSDQYLQRVMQPSCNTSKTAASSAAVFDIMVAFFGEEQDVTLQCNRLDEEEYIMPLVMENDARRVAVERLSNADRLWTDVALPYGCKRKRRQTYD